MNKFLYRRTRHVNFREEIEKEKNIEERFYQSQDCKMLVASSECMKLAIYLLYLNIFFFCLHRNTFLLFSPVEILFFFYHFEQYHLALINRI